MQMRRNARTVLAGVFASVLSVSALASITLAPTTPVAAADDQPPSMSEYQQKVNHQAELKKQLAGVGQKLAQLVIKLDDLTEVKIPAAEHSLDVAQQEVVRTQGLVKSTSERLQAAQKDKANLERQIATSGKNYDQAQQAVAQLARESFHTSDASTVISVITKSTTANDFVNKLQAKAAVARSEAMLADRSALTFSTAQNRHDRVQAIERLIAELQREAEAQAATARLAKANAQAKRAELSRLREEGEKDRKALESQKSSITTQAAREAIAIVELKSKIDAYNRVLAQQRAQENLHAAGRQQLPPPAGVPAPVVNRPSAPAYAQGMNYTVPGNCYEGMTYCYGHPTGTTSVLGNAYPWSECTWYAYHRRVDYFHLPTGSYMGNGGDWARSGRRLGYLVNHTPHVGAAIVFHPGQSYADPIYGHVAVVERINADGSILISECYHALHGRIQFRTIYNPGAYEYVHY